ncbi:MAG: exopolysaccharide biosynthesis polyprenyl glycosylphosphotransferase [Schleiferiaceae bacterium]
MEYRPQSVRQREFGLRLADGLLLILVFWGGVALRFGDLQAENPAYFDHYLRLAEWLAIFWFLLGWVGQPYRLDAGVELRNVLGRFVRQTGLLLALTALLVVSLKTYVYSRVFLVGFFGTYLALGALLRVAVVRSTRARFRRGIGLVGVCGLGSSPMWDRVERELSERPDYGYRWLGAVDQLDVLPSGVTELWITPDRVLDELDAAELRGLRVRVIPDLAALPAARTRWSALGSVLLLDWRQEPLASGWARALKRGGDVLGSSLALAVLAPLVLLVALWIRLRSKGPVLFSQVRHGYRGEVFTIWKFRTMAHGADADRAAQPGDDRVRHPWLRATHLDELPQLWNVLRGDMSLVGPRPHMASDTQRYADAVRSYGIRHWVRPGITGLAQARGLHGFTDQASMTERVKADVYYVEHWSVALDLKILVATLLRVKDWV